MRPSLPLLLLLAAACEREWVREYDGAVPGANWEWATVLVVRDYLTGRPIPGAIVSQHPEWELGDDGGWAPLLDERRTDRFGIATFPLPEDPGNCHWAVRASGYAPAEHYGTRAADAIDLYRGWERAGRLVGIGGAPLAGVKVQYKRGCAHAPALVETRTDATGVFVFPRAIEGDYVFEDPRCMADYWCGEEPRPRRFGIPTYRVWPGATLVGRVLRGDGTPPPWATVLTNGRDPRALAGPDGSFVLRGVHPEAPLFVWCEEGLPEFDPATCRPGGPVTLYIDRAPADAPPTAVRIRLLGEDGAPPRVLTPVHLDRVADGRRFTLEWSPWGEGTVRALVPPGSYVVSAGAPRSALVAEPRPLEVRGPCDLEVVVRPGPTLEFDRSALPKAPCVLCSVLLEDRHWPIDDALQHGDDVHLPAAARAWLRVRIDKQFECDFPIGPEHAGVRRAEVRLPGQKEIRVLGLSGSYEAYLLHGDLVTYAVGTRWVVVDHEELGRALKRVELPWEAGTVEVRDLAFEPWTPRAEVRVVDAQGRGVPGADVSLLDDPRMPDWPTWDRRETCDEAGVLRDRHVSSGMHVRVEAPGFLPHWTRLSGDPPWEIRLGDCAVDVDLAHVADARCVFDTVTWLGPGDDGHLVLRGVPAGPHTLIVGAPGRRSLAYRLLLQDGETRRIAPVLPAR